MFNRILIVSLIMLLVASCNKRYEAAMKSSDSELVLKTAHEFFEEKKWTFAIELYGKVANHYVGKEEAADISYNSAYANFEDENRRLAAHQFKNFNIAFPQDPRAEDAAFRSAYAYYLDSPKYNLDQTSTINAIDELQSFISAYPNSERVKEANEYIDELRKKLEKKAFEIARIYYKTMKYKAAGVAFDNMLEDYPDTAYREEAMMYSLRSKYELAVNYSRSEVQDLRLQEAKTQYKILMKNFPNSEYKEEADKIFEELESKEAKLKEKTKTS